MSTPQHDLERVVALARSARTPELPDTDLRRMVRRGVVAAVERRARAQQRWWLALAGAACCLILVIGPWSPLHEPLRARLFARDPASAPHRPALDPLPAPAPASADWQPLELALPSGDRVVASPAADLELLMNAAHTRRIALRSGSAVFSVRRLASGETFAVQTPQAYVEVRGTVFSVDVARGVTRVRVHEGAVQVQSEAGVRRLQAGERYGSDGAAVPELAAPLAARATELTRERLERTPEPLDRDAAIGPGHESPTERPDATAALVAARAQLEAGDAGAALAAALTVRSSKALRGEWLMLQGDALRSLGRAREAVDAYAQAEAALEPLPSAQAAFKAADLCLRVLSDPAATLRVVDRARLDADGAPLRERALLLRIEASQRLGLSVRALAQRYLAAYPDSAGAARVRVLVEAPDPQ